MGTHKSENIRSFAIAAHGGAGKTSLTEAMLFDTGVITRMGTVENGNTVTDFGPEEQKRRISINTGMVNLCYRDKTIYILDTPGFADFIGEMRSAMRVSGSTVLVVSGVDGVEVQTEKAWAFSDDFKNPVAFFINKLDRENSNFMKAVEEIKEHLSDRAMPFYLPIGTEADFKGLVDVLRGKAYMYSGDGSSDFEEIEVPAEMEEEVEAFRGSLIENIVEEDDELVMRYLDGENLSMDDVWPALRKAINERHIFPIIPGSATANVGVFQLLDLICDAFPVPAEHHARVAMKEEEEIEIAPNPDEIFTALCFKVMVDPYVGKLSFIRVNSGRLTTEDIIYNVNCEEEERISSFRMMNGKEGVDIKEIAVGDIVAIPKLQSTRVGDTLSVKGSDIHFPAIKFPHPVFSLAVEAKSRADEDKLSSALHKMLEEDLTLTFEKNVETGDNVLSGMGNIHLDIVLSRIKERYGVELETRTPQVPYRETIRKAAKAQGKHKKQTGGHGQYGDVHIEFSPLSTGQGFEFEDKIVGGAIPRGYIPAVEKGLREAMQKGVLAGFPVVDFKASLFFGSYHDVDSSEMAFKTAAHLAFKKGMVDASPVLLEPIVDVEVNVAKDFLGDVMGDFNSRRGRIMGIDSRGSLQVVRAQVPMSEMFQYSIILRSMTSGRGDFTMAFSHYDPVPNEMVKKIIAKREAEKEEVK